MNDIGKNTAPGFTKKENENYANKGINELNRKFTSSKGSGITLTNNEIKIYIK